MTTIIKSIVKADMAPDKLVLEVTETAIMHDPDAAFKVLAALESLGVRISIDDFGTGHSSMTYLKNFPIGEVKLDRSFITDIEHSSQGYNIVRSTIELSHNLKATTVGEGVETKEIEDMLRELNIDHIQGYYIAKPMPLKELIEWLKNYKDANYE
jgi:EAL domain-containing protein (putative c-di-GMP-specific phosphodiesterase class I)